MKRIIFFLSTCLLSLAVFSQSQLPHYYDFDDADQLTQGWSFVSGSPGSWNEMLASVQNQRASSQPNAWAFSSVFPDEISYNQYLISPRIANPTSDSVIITFKYLADNSGQTESFTIGYFTGDSWQAMSDFSWKDTLYTNTTNWTAYSVALPANVQYVCINYNSQNQSALYIDDILIKPQTNDSQYIITVIGTEGGVITPGTVSVDAGDSVRFTVTPNEGHHIASVWVDGVAVCAASDEPFSYTLYDISDNHTITANFHINEYTLSIQSSAGGTITPDGGQLGFLIVPWDTSITFSMSAASHYHIADVIIDNVTHLGNINTYSFNHIRDNHQIQVIFAIDSYTISASANAGGTITPSGDSIVGYGSNISYSIAADEHYRIDSLVVDGTIYLPQSPDAMQFSFTDVQANHTITAFFSLKRFIVHATHTLGGEWQISGGISVGTDSVEVEYGSNLTCTPIPHRGYKLTGVEINTNPTALLPSYSLSNITNDYTIHASFDTLTYSFITVAHGNGAIVPGIIGQTNFFDTVSFTIIPNHCKTIDSVLLDGQLLTIFDEYQFTELSGSHVLAAYFSTIRYDIQLEQTGIGSISGPTQVECGTSPTYTLTHGPCYHLENVFIDGINSNHLVQTINQNALITLQNIESNHVIEAVFARTNFTITVSSDENGHTTHVGTNNISCGDNFALVMTPNTCYQIDSVMLDGVLINSSLTYFPHVDPHYGDTATLILNDIERNHTISVIYKPITHTITSIQSNNGTITPVGNTEMLCGESVDFSIVPDECFEIDSVWLDDIFVNAQLQYTDYHAVITIDDITAPHHLRATFKQRQYNITTIVGNNGTLISNNQSPMNCGDDYHFTLVPDYCYQIDSVFYNGQYINNLLEYRHNTNPQIGDSALCVLENTSEDVELRVSFVAKSYQISMEARGNGTISNSLHANTALCGNSVTFTITPDPCLAIDQIILNGEYFYQYEVTDGVAVFTVPQILMNTTVLAIFRPVYYTIQSNAVNGGSIIYPNNPQTCGTDIPVRLLPYSCHHLDSLFVDGMAISLSEIQLIDDTLTYIIQNIDQNHSIEAHFAIDSVTIHASNNILLPLSLEDTTVPCGNNVTLYTIINDCLSFKSVTINGISSDGNTLPYTFYTQISEDTIFFHFDMIPEDLQVIFYYDTIYYDVTITSSDHGNVNVEGSNRVMCGQDLPLIITPDSCCHLVSIWTNSTNQITENEAIQLLTNIHSDIHLRFEFAPTIYQFTRIAGQGGTITCNHPISVYCGDSITCFLKPNECFKVDSVFLDNQLITNILDTINGIISYTIPHIQANHELRATFIPSTYEVHIASNGYGYVSLINDTIVECGTDLSFAVKPYDCNNLNNITIDDGDFTQTPVFINDTMYYLLNNITENHHLFVNFNRNPKIFQKKTHIIGESETIEIAPIFCHTDTTVELTFANECIVTDSVYVNGIRIEDQPSVTLVDIMSNTYIEIYAHRLSYEVEIVQVPYGRISPETEFIKCGDTVHYTFTPAQNCFVQNLIIDDDTLEGNTSYTLEGVRAPHTISAIFMPYTFNIEVICGEGGSISPTSCMVNANDSLRFNITPDSCYLIDSLIIDGYYKGTRSTYLFSEIDADHRIEAKFKLKEAHLHITAGTNGIVTPDGDSVLTCGDSLYLTITPNDCYQTGRVRIDGTWSNHLLEVIDGQTVLPLRNIAEDHDITVDFEPIYYTFDAYSNGGGTISPMFSMPPCGSDFQFSIDPASCFAIDSVWINDTFIPLDSFNFIANTAYYTIHDVTSDMQIYVKFRDVPHLLSFTNEANGEISISDTNILCGNDVSFYILPNTCFSIDSVWSNNICINHLLDYHATNSQAYPDTAFYTIQNFSADNHIIVTYKPAEDRIITRTYYANNQVIEEISTSVACGSDTTLTLDYDCYHLDSVWLNNIYYGNNNSINLSNIIENQTITIFLSIDEYTVTIENTPNGHASPNGNNTVHCGDDLTITFLPNDGYFTDSLIIDGDTIVGNDSYTFTNVRENHSLSAIFNTYTYRVTTQTGNGGFIIPATSYVDYGDDITLQIVPDSCHYIDSVWLDGVYQGNNDEITLTHITDNHNVTATFTAWEYSISVENTINGSITPNGINRVTCGNDLTFTITPETGYYIENLIIDGDTIAANDSYTFFAVRQNHTIGATFEILSYEISTSAGNGGAFTPTTSYVDYGDDITLQIVPDSCHYIDSVWLDGVYQGNSNEITLTHITDNHNVTATFTAWGYSISVENTINGSITPNGINRIDCGNDLTFTIAPETGYYIENLIIDGDTIAPNDNYTFTDVRENHTIGATFEIISYQISTRAGNGGSITPTTSYVNYGDDITLQIIPEDCHYINAIWLDGVYQGNNSEITLTHITANHNVIVTFTTLEYSISVGNTINGSITPNGINRVTCGNDLTFTITPETGYYIENLIIDGNSIAPSDDYTFTDIRENHTISATFGILNYEISTSAGNGGTISPATSYVDYGDDITLQIVPEDCHYIDSVWLDGVYQGNSNEITLTHITDNHNVTATFAALEYSISVENTLNGSITPNGVNRVVCGNDLTFAIAPESGYYIENLIIDGDTIIETNTYTFSNIHENHTLSAIFNTYTYCVTTQANNGGTILPATSYVNYGDDITLQIVPDSCHYIDSVWLDGVYQGNSNEITLTHITDNHNVTANFAALEYSITVENTTNGNIIPNGSNPVVCGNDLTFAIAPETGYYIENLIIDGDTIAANDNYTFTDIRENHTIGATFAIYNYQITTTVGNGGTISPATSYVDYGDSITLQIVPEDCHTINAVWLDGVYQGNSNEITLTHITDNHNVTATFAAWEYSISVENTTNGSITPNGVNRVICGNGLTFAIAPETGYYIENLIIDGDTIAANDNYTFTDIRENHTIGATFAIYNYQITTTVGNGGTISPATSYVDYGDSITLQIVPEDCHYIDSVWLDGIYQGNSNEITLTHITDNHNVTATFAAWEYSITVENTTNGNITPNGVNRVVCGNDLTFAIAPEAGYYIENLIIDGDTIAANDNYTFTDGRENHTIGATFAIYNYQITTTVGNGGTISPATSYVDYGDDITLQIVPEDCHYIDSIWLDGVYQGNNDEITLTHITDNHNVTATFAALEYSITVENTTNGSITPNGINRVICGNGLTFAIAPETGYYIENLIIDGDTIAANDNYTFTDVRENHTIGATFAIYNYQITTTVGNGGTISPATSYVDYGDSITLQIVPEDCHYIDSVWLDGIYQGNNDEITLTNITDNHNITATFAALEYSISVESTMNGNITPNGINRVICGNDLTFAIASETGYYIENLIIDGDTIAANDNYTFTDIRENHTIGATFGIYNYQITTTVGNGGTISPATSYVDYGDSITLQIVPEDCHYIDSVWLDGVYQGNSNEITLTHNTDNHNVTATFSALEYSISVENTTNGNITPNGINRVICGNDLTFAIAPETGYYIENLIIDGDTIAANDNYTFTDVRENHTIGATFGIYNYLITTTAGNGGTISPATSYVDYGDNITLQIVPEDCHYIDSVWLDGVYQGNSNEITLTHITDNHNVTATFAAWEYFITVENTINGNITPNGVNRVVCGNGLTFAIAPETGYYIENLIIDGDTIAPSDNYTFTDVRANHTIGATFGIYNYQITTTVGNGGTISPATSYVDYGDDITLQIVPEDCHYIDSVWLDGVYQGNSNEITLTNITDNHNVTATFTAWEYFITVENTINGNITPNGVNRVVCGNDLTFAIAPETGYYIENLIIDGDTIAPSDNYTFTDVRENHTIGATFGIYNYQITTTADNGGTISPATSYVDYGDDITLQIVPEDCHYIDSVWLDGVYQGNNDEITLTNITDNHNITATFAALEFTVRAQFWINNQPVLDSTSLISCGSDTIILTAIDCYQIDSLIVNNEIITNMPTYYIANIHANQEIRVYLSDMIYDVVSSVEGDGTISPADTSHVGCGTNLTFNFAPNAGSYLYDLIIDGESLGSVNTDSYTFTDIHQNHTIHVIFASNQYIITASVEPTNGGNITPYGSSFVDYGEDITYTITAHPNFEIVDVAVDGMSVGNVSTYTFENVDNNHTITAYFSGVGINDRTLENVSVYTNGNTLFIDNQSQTQIDAITVYDVQGKKVYETGTCNSSIQTTLPVITGTYLVYIRQGKNYQSYKVYISQW